MMAGTADLMPLHILLIGKTGHGKSATGNSIVGRKAFKTSSGPNSETKIVKDAWTVHGRNEIKVVDGPGLEDTDLDAVQNKEQACENMAKALMMCNGGVHVFVLVISFGCRFTEEERRTISDLKQIFGDNYLRDWGIIVITGGDQFRTRMEADGAPGKTFKEWCGEQTNDFGNLIQECSPRIVIFNNISKSEEEKTSQRNELLRHAEELRQNKGLYTSEHFQVYAQVRAKMIKDSKQKILEETLQKRIDLLSAELIQLSIDSSQADVDRLDARIKDVCTEIGDEGRQQESMKQLITNLERLSSTSKELRRAIKDKNMRNILLHVSTLSRANQELNEARQIPWGYIFAGVGIGLGIGALILGGAAVVAVSRGSLAVLTPVGRALAPMGSALLRFAMDFVNSKIRLL